MSGTVDTGARHSTISPRVRATSGSAPASGPQRRATGTARMSSASEKQVSVVDSSGAASNVCSGVGESLEEVLAVRPIGRGFLELLNVLLIEGAFGKRGAEDEAA